MIEPIIRPMIEPIIRPIIGEGGVLPPGPFPLQQATYYNEPVGGSTADRQYQTELDGQDDFWLRGASWTGSADSEIVIEFYPTVNNILQRLVDFDQSANIRLRSTDGNLLFTGMTGPVGMLNGNVVTSGSASPVYGEINVASVRGNYSGQTFSVLGCRADQGGNFFNGAIRSLCLIDHNDSGNSYVYKFDSNGQPIAPIGVEYFEGDSVPTSAFTFQNGEPDGSDQYIIDRKSDNSGWTDGVTDYDYAAGSNP